MHLTAGILTHNDAKYLSRCLETLMAQQGLGELGANWQIIVLDNGSYDIEYLLAAKQKYAALQFQLEKENLGFGKGHNRIMKRYPADFHAVLNCDVLFAENYLALLLEVLEANQEYGSATGKLLHWNLAASPDKTSVIDSAGLRMTKSCAFLDRGQGEEDRGQYYRGEKIFGASGAAALYRRSALEKVKFFDETFFMYKEDCDLALRLNVIDKPCIYVPEARAWHARTATSTMKRSDRSRKERILSAAHHTIIIRKHLNRFPFSIRLLTRLRESARWTLLFLTEPRIFFSARSLISTLHCRKTGSTRICGETTKQKTGTLSLRRGRGQGEGHEFSLYEGKTNPLPTLSLCEGRGYPMWVSTHIFESIRKTSHLNIRTNNGLEARSTPLVSAITLFHNERSGKEAASCVKALQEQTIAGKIEIITLVNDAPESAVSFFGRNQKNIRLVRYPTNAGYGKGNNEAARLAHGTYLLIINPDTRLRPDALELMVEFLEKNSDVGIVGPKLIFPNGTVRDSYRTFPSPLDVFIKRTPLQRLFRKRMKSYLQWDMDPDKTRDVDWLCGACFLIKRELFEELGGFDERFFLFFEDCDLCRRVWEKGLRVVYLPNAQAHDNEQRLSAGGVFSLFTKKTVRIHFASAVKYFWKWRSQNTLPGTAPR